MFCRGVGWCQTPRQDKRNGALGRPYHEPPDRDPRERRARGVARGRPRPRRATCLRGTPGLLAGVRLKRPEEVAREVLVRAGVGARPTLPPLHVVALRSLLARGGGCPSLAYLRPDDPSYAE